MATNKQMAQAFLQKSFDGDLDDAFDLLSEDALIWVAGHFSPTCGWHTKSTYRLLEALAGKAFPQGIRVNFDTVIGEADRVAITCSSTAPLRNGDVYRNDYHFLLSFRDGAICEVREYNDTHHAWDCFVKGRDALPPSALHGSAERPDTTRNVTSEGNTG